MSEARFFPLNKFLMLDRGDPVPEPVTVLRWSKREIVAIHRNAFEARKELKYAASLRGANTLLNVWVESLPSYRYCAHGIPAVSARRHPRGTHTADELRANFHMYRGTGATVERREPPKPVKRPPRDWQMEELVRPLLKGFGFIAGFVLLLKILV